jgi:hypothetical protein
VKNLSSPRIVAAANRSGVDGLLVIGARHFDKCMRDQIKACGRKHTEFNEQGFIDQHCKFYTREEAYLIADSNNKIVRRCGGDSGTLYSENLY